MEVLQYKKAYKMSYVLLVADLTIIYDMAGWMYFFSSWCNNCPPPPYAESALVSYAKLFSQKARKAQWLKVFSATIPG